eukprot:CAMPEP_0116880484 /NCGR_PEP_ID=MMETSP0463-20121206/12418_1 /TAXON_ID=181622 /ORGANISM="Strombidinopsis sp, Strain SopsisLIS2011" /LENGTH=56 /DNA_ID=CAMNT_0004531119 /DNA_START=1284 /DNA_END=1454 /DNA_ORIENTATION=+
MIEETTVDTVEEDNQITPEVDHHPMVSTTTDAKEVDVEDTLIQDQDLLLDVATEMI